MRKQQSEVFGDVKLIQNRQGLLLEKPKNAQQQLFHLRAQRHLLSKQMLHKNIDEVLKYLPGTFVNLALRMLYFSICIEMKVELNTEDHPLLKKLMEWTEIFPKAIAQNKVQFMANITPKNDVSSFTDYEQYITFLNFIGADLVKLIKKRKTQKQQTQIQKSENTNLAAIDPDDLLVFLINSLPKVLYNIILSNDVLPGCYKQNYKAMEILYRHASYEYFVKTKTSYAALMKIMVKTLLKLELKPSQQKAMIEIVFRYFYAYHHEKQFNATDIFIQAFNKLSQTTRFALADEFVMFLKIISKIGKIKFVNFLVEKSPWIKEIYVKVQQKNLVGYAKQNFSPYNQLKVAETITIPNGKSQIRTFQVLEDYSLIYYSLDILNHDITLKMYYLGENTDKKTSKILLLTNDKLSGKHRTNLMAAKRGLYQFQFDNTYSWINSKIIKFQKVILSPLQLKSPQQDQWIPNFYDAIYLNQMTDKKQIYLIQKVGPQLEENGYQGTGNITKVGEFFNLKVIRNNHLYEFETTSEQKIVKKFNEYADKKIKIKWTVNGDPIDTPDSKEIIFKCKEKKVENEPKKEQTTVTQENTSQKEKVQSQAAETLANQPLQPSKQQVQ